MPLSKHDTVRALQLLKELLIHAEETEDESVLLPLEEVSDALRSSLFNELIDIHNNLNKPYSDPSYDSSWSDGTDMSPKEHSELSNIGDHHSPLHPSINNPSNKAGRTDSADVLKEELSPAQILPILPSTEFETPLSQSSSYHHQTTPIDEASPFRTTTRSLTAETGDQFTSILVDTPEHEDSDMQARKKKKMKEKDGESVKGMSSSIKYLVEKEDSPDYNETDVSLDSRDLLSPLRDQKSLFDIKKAIHGRFGREQRTVALEQQQSSNGLGMELVGLSRSGIFISSLMPKGEATLSNQLQTGDQVLRVNDTSCDGITAFEISHLIENVPPGQLVTLTVVYNPTGLKEYQRLRTR